MPSVFAWVDFAEEDRRKMAEVIDLFREKRAAYGSIIAHVVDLIREDSVSALPASTATDSSPSAARRRNTGGGCEAREVSNKGVEAAR